MLIAYDQEPAQAGCQLHADARRGHAVEELAPGRPASNGRREFESFRPRRRQDRAASCRCCRALGPRLHAAAAAGPLPAQLPAQLPAHAAANTPVPAPVPAPVPTPIAHARTHARTKATGAAGAVGGGGAGGARMLSGGASRAAEQRREPAASRAAEQRREPAATPASRMPASNHPPDLGRRGCRIDGAQAKSVLPAFGGSSGAEVRLLWARGRG